MKRIDKLKKALIGSCLLAVGLSGQAWAQEPICESSSEGANIGVVGGSASCASWGMSGCVVENPGGSCTATDDGGDPMFTVNTAIVDGEVSWSIVYPEGSQDYNSAKIGAIDVSIWEGAKKGQNYPFLFRYDEGAAPDAVTMSCNGGTATQGLHFCMDGLAEFSPVFENPCQPEVGLACDSIGSTDVMATIYGVDIDVTDVVPGQGLTTITVARSNRQCDPDNSNTDPLIPDCVNTTTYDGTAYWEADPSFGFAQGGQITLTNICLAEGGQFVTEDQCDPDKEIVNGPFIDSLDECTDRVDGIVREEVSVGYEGSGYVGYGGSRRYY